MHYICTGGCEGVSNERGVCQDQNCRDYHKDLAECDCTDGEHTVVKEQAVQAEASQTPN